VKSAIIQCLPILCIIVSKVFLLMNISPVSLHTTSYDWNCKVSICDLPPSGGPASLDKILVRPPLERSQLTCSFSQIHSTIAWMNSASTFLSIFPPHAGYHCFQFPSSRNARPFASGCMALRSCNWSDLLRFMSTPHIS